MSRLVVLMRHGEALSPHVDAERGLSPRGVDRARATARRLRDVAHPELIEHSGLVRAAQTAALLAEEWGAPAGSVSERSGIRPESDPEPVARELAAAGPDVALVSHLPFVPRLAALLSGGVYSGHSGLEDAGAIVLRGAGREWTVERVLGPSEP